MALSNFQACKGLPGPRNPSHKQISRSNVEDKVQCISKEQYAFKLITVILILSAAGHCEVDSFSRTLPSKE